MLERDEVLEQLCGHRADRFVGSRSLSPAHLLLLARIWWRLHFVPMVRLRLEEGSEEALILRWLRRDVFGVRTMLHQAASVLQVERRGDTLAGSRFATLRRMERKAAKFGITCREVFDEERDELLALATDFERAHPDPRYRREKPNLEGLRAVGLWILAVDIEGRPLALSITPISGSTALLRFLRTLHSGQAPMLARYALTAGLLRALAARRVTYLVDNVSPIALPSPLRHFATMVGFRIARVELKI